MVCKCLYIYAWLNNCIILLFNISDKARHTSLPEGASNPRLNPGRRVNTFSGLGSTEVLNEAGNRPNVPQQETLLDPFAQPVLQDVTSTSVSYTSADVDQRNQTTNTGMELCEQTREPVLTSTPVGPGTDLSHGSQNSSSSNVRQRSRHVSEILRGGNTSSPFVAGSISRSDSFPASQELMRHQSKPPSTSTSHDPFPPSITSLSDWSSTAGEMLLYNENAQRMGVDPAVNQTHFIEGTQEHDQFTPPAATPLFAVGPPANSKSMSIPPSPTFPAENQVSYDHRFDSIEGRERRANSVIPSEYVLINEQLHKLRSFHVPSDQDYRRSFTPPASIPLARGASLIEPTPARARVTSPLSEHNKFIPGSSLTNGTYQSIECSSELSSPVTHDQVQPLRKQTPLAPVDHNGTQEAEVKHGWPEHAPNSNVQQSEIQQGKTSAFSRLGTGLKRKDSTDTLTNSISPPLQSPTPPSKGI